MLLGLCLLLLPLAPLAAPLFVAATAPLPHVVAPPSIRSLSAHSCRPCHQITFAQWQGSRHAAAATNSLFRSSFRQEPLDWCKHCHAPLPEQEAALHQVRDIQPGSSGIVAEGVTCVVCHVRDGVILSARPGSRAGQRAHPMRHEPELAAASFCGNCHQANWLSSLTQSGSPEPPMQDTLGEFQRSQLPQRSCQDCHMPGGSHRWPGGHDIDALRRVLEARVWIEGREHLQVVLHARGVGHRLPTGDPFRRIQLDICTDPDCEQLLLTFSFGRFFLRRDGHEVLVRDTALSAPRGAEPSERRLTHRLNTPPEPKGLFWRLQYAYAAPSTEPELQESDRSVELARGKVASAQLTGH